MTEPPGDDPTRERAAWEQYGPAPAHPPDHPRATTALVLGILGVVVCGVAAPFAWQMGKRAVAEIDASNGRLGGRGSAEAGYVLGIVGTVLLGLGVLVLVMVLVLVVVLAGGTMISSSS
jgi:uncharacterized membrane protein YjgN (DUF898 family)